MSTQEIIESKIKANLAPEFLEVINESHGHNVAPGSETHFKLTIVSQQFASLTLVRRHQRLYQLLAEELSNGVHALALHTFTPEEWSQNQRSLESPNCLGGAKS